MAGPEAPKQPAPAAATGKFDLKNIKLNAKQQQTLIIAVLLIGFGGYAYWTYGLKPLRAAYARKQAELKTAQEEYDKATKMAERYKEFLEEEKTIKRRSDFMNRRLPKDNTIADTIREITKAATESNIRIVNFTPDQKEDLKGTYKESKIALDFDTNFKDLGNFLTRIGYIDQLITPSELRISAVDKGRSGQADSNITVTMNIKIYSFME
jgi:Tfp pilus assembly protein PilO